MPCQSGEALWPSFVFAPNYTAFEHHLRSQTPRVDTVSLSTSHLLKTTLPPSGSEKGDIQSFCVLQAVPTITNDNPINKVMAVSRLSKAAMAAIISSAVLMSLMIVVTVLYLVSRIYERSSQSSVQNQRIKSNICSTLQWSWFRHPTYQRHHWEDETYHSNFVQNMYLQEGRRSQCDLLLPSDALSATYRIDLPEELVVQGSMSVKGVTRDPEVDVVMEPRSSREQRGKEIELGAV